MCLESVVNVNGGTPKQVEKANDVAHKAPVFDSFRIIVGRPEPGSLTQGWQCVFAENI